MNFLRQISYLLLFAFLAGCSAWQQSSSSNLAPSQGSALVFFYRLQGGPGAPVSVDIMDNGIDIGKLPAGAYFVYHANPGVHEFTLTTESTARQRLQLQTGATYYIKADVSKNPLHFRPTLGVVFELQGKTDIQQLKRIKYHE